MRIGQLTFHSSHNYGSVLQAYAISKVLEVLGHTTEFINLRPQIQKDVYRIIRGKGIHRIFHLLLYPALKKRYQNYERFINKVLPITRKEYSDTEELEAEQFDYDAYVCGGDQIWNPVCQDFESAYYLQFLDEQNQAKKISYSPSFGRTEFDEKTLRKIGNWIKKFDAISVREVSGTVLAQRFTDKKVMNVCDPVLLLCKNEWSKFAVSPKYKTPYILVYFLENNHGSRELIEYLRKITGYIVVTFNEYIRDFFRPYYKEYSASPEEFVGLFQNASLIYTNSFHGTVFATIFEKPFLSAVAADQVNAKNNNDSRKIDYLRKIGLENRLYTTGRPTKEFVLEIDYKQARLKIESFRKESLEFLMNALR